jgi:ketosteroid isomerase-like protein
MKPIAIIGLAAGLLFAMPAAAQNAAVEAPIKAFADGFSKGDMAAAMATHVSTGATIVDELPPYLWSGASSFTDWGASFAKDAAANGITEPSVALGTPTRELITGDTAYVIVPATYTFKQKGVAMREVAQMTFALTRTAAGWKIAAWTWTGPNPTRANKPR